MSRKLESNEPMLRALVDEAELRTASRDGVKRPIARATLAQKWGVSFWTLTNYRRGRLKDLRGEMISRIKAGLISGIESEIRKLEHDLLLVRQSGSTLSEANILQAEAALEQARKFLKGH
jgi:hypothetical protein